MYSDEVLLHWDHFVENVRRVSTGTIDGQRLDIATVVAVARLLSLLLSAICTLLTKLSRYSASVCLDNGTLNSIKESADALATSLRDGEIIYGP